MRWFLKKSKKRKTNLPTTNVYLGHRSNKQRKEFKRSARFRKLKTFLDISRKWKAIMIIGLFLVLLLVFMPRMLIDRQKYISPLPLISIDEKNNSNSAITQQIALELRNKHILFDRIDISVGNYYTVFLTGSGEVILGTNRSLPEQIASLQVILVRLTMEGRSFARLDLRFDKPVVIFSD